MLGFFNGNFSKSIDGNYLFGDYKKLKEIAEKSGKEVELIDINNQEMQIQMDLGFSSFFGISMERLVAKIAYEWFCYLNEINEKYDEFEPIINFIETGKNNQFVSYTVDTEIYKIFSEITVSNSHTLLLYEDENNNINVLVSMFGICIYKVNLGSKIPIDFKMKFGFTELQITTKKIEISEKNYLEYEKNIMDNVVFIVAENTTISYPLVEPDRIRKGLGIINLLRTINKNSFVVKYNQTLVDIVLSNYKATLNSAIIHIRKLKRFVKESFPNLIMENKLNSKGISNDTFFLYYIIYLIGKYNVKLDNPDDINEFLRGTIKEDWEFNLDMNFIVPLKNEMFKDVEYEKVLLKGAKLVNDAKYF